ncbi:transcriptional regulatory protein ZraR [Clostridium homopropionicum DSM 5847]|uniref:Transcriptional regulatory protein ZraR n=1 Tax=Clostridium homopropionicum DSM 5847 TaxID=1121318 RepID=A0A0L6ZAE2_9CLOT|nr:sigma-54-dependent Fis family transcriptional regulator [Clostridium homopropionicum]KOA19937.1 transcriptional regulatory protein ZraR [Clostridium homopropionicum DSM 5847]SFG87987.1 Transcriptional regulator containing PAS, AAA-type ATPase, and DNA-binding Fis domains [Clostridium homopropionicum]
MQEQTSKSNIDKLLTSIPPSIFNKLPLPINFVDENCRVIVMNQAFLDYIGSSIKDVVGKHLSEVDPSVRLPLVLKTGIPELGRKHKFHNGKEALVDRIPLIDEGKVMGGVGIILLDDLTNRELRNSIITTINPSIPENVLETFRPKYNFDDILSQSPIGKKCKSQAKSFAVTDLPVLITGESGVGKELFAHSIHDFSNRHNKPFVSVNCAAIPEQLIESELFGYEGGSFTGANKGGKPGKFELANGGTIFLDEIGDLPLSMQVKLLRALQENQIEKIGSNKMINTDVRIIAATNCNLEEKVAKKEFRADLYYRLNVLNLHVPTLKERSADIAILIDHFITSFYQRCGIIKTFPQEIIDILVQYDWPGNIRELRNIVERLAVVSPGEEISKDALPNYILETSYKSTAKLYTSSLTLKSSLNNILEEVETQIIKDTLRSCNFNKSQAADILGIPRMTLYRKLKKIESEEVSE